MTNTKHQLWFVALGAAALGACGPSSIPDAKLAPGTPPVQFAKDLDELEASLTPRGKPLVVNHWATWCMPCIEEMPYLAEVAKKYEGKADFVGVAWDNLKGKATQPGPAQDSTRVAIDNIRVKTGARYAILVAPPSIEAVAKRLTLLGEVVPQTFVFDKNGQRVFALLGEFVEDTDKAAFENAIRAAAGN